jgi:arylsulfatase
MVRRRLLSPGDVTPCNGQKGEAWEGGYCAPGFDQREYLEGQSANSAREVFCYYSRSTQSAVRYKNWKMHYTMSQPGAIGWLLPLTTFHFTLVQNIKRDPFERAVGTDQKTVMSFGGALAAPSTAYLYDWNLLAPRSAGVAPGIGVVAKFPPLQAPESYNLSPVMEEVKKANANTAGD